MQTAGGENLPAVFDYHVIVRPAGPWQSPDTMQNTAPLDGDAVLQRLIIGAGYVFHDLLYLTA